MHWNAAFRRTQRSAMELVLSLILQLTRYRWLLSCNGLVFTYPYSACITCGLSI